MNPCTNSAAGFGTNPAPHQVTLNACKMRFACTRTKDMLLTVSLFVVRSIPYLLRFKRFVISPGEENMFFDAIKSYTQLERY